MEKYEELQAYLTYTKNQKLNRSYLTSDQYPKDGVPSQFLIQSQTTFPWKMMSPISFYGKPQLLKNDSEENSTSSQTNNSDGIRHKYALNETLSKVGFEELEETSSSGFSSYGRSMKGTPTSGYFSDVDIEEVEDAELSSKADKERNIYSALSPVFGSGNLTSIAPSAEFMSEGDEMKMKEISPPGSYASSYEMEDISTSGYCSDIDIEGVEETATLEWSPNTNNEELILSRSEKVSENLTSGEISTSGPPPPPDALIAPPTAMAMDLEKPGVESRSSSPSSCSASTLKFSIERILSSEFGVVRNQHSPRSPDHHHHHHPPSSPLHDKSSSGGKDIGEKNFFFPSSKPADKEAILSNALMVEMPWLYASRTSCRPSSGPRRIRSKHSRKGSDDQDLTDDPESPRTRRIRKSKESDKKRPRTAFNDRQLQILRAEFEANRYLTEKRRLDLSKSLNLNESQVKIWFQNRRAKCKRSLKHKSPLALQLMAKGLYNHSTIAIRDDEDDEKSKS